MSQIKYTVYQVSASSISEYEDYSNVDKLAMDSFQLYSSFNPYIDKVELHIYSLDGERLSSNTDHKNFLITEGAGTQGLSLTLNPSQDSIDNEYPYGGVQLLYNFVHNFYATDIVEKNFIIKEISGDRTELKLISQNIDDELVRDVTQKIKQDLSSTSDFSEFRVNVGNNDNLIAVNLDLLEEGENTYVVVKLHTPIPSQYQINQLAQIQNVVSDTAVFEIETEVIPDEIKIPQLKGPNFTIDVQQESGNASEYFTYSELTSFPVNNTYRQLTSLAKQKNIQISIDHSDFGDFVQFGSAVERLENFKYKLDLIHSYQESLDLVESTSNNQDGISGSRDYYHGQINQILENFDHYDRFLYYESSSHAWPKTDLLRPYTNMSGSSTGSWYVEKLTSASAYDESNYSSLVNSIPSYIKDDTNNAPYNLFVQMIGQHFDNIWIYAKAVTDKYDGDNRLDFGISKELVEAALKNYGVKLYASNRSTQDLFKMFTGDFYNTGSEDITTFVTASNQATSEEDYRKQVFKRIHHNLPLLLKSKGTERGLRVLMNCFGINNLTTSGSHNGLLVRQEGGGFASGSGNLGPSTFVTSSLGKIRFDNTGSIISGDTLSSLTTVVKRDHKYADEIPSVEVGYSPTDVINDYILENSSSIDIDEFIGDPRLNFELNYPKLENKAQQTLHSLNSYDLQDLTRILKFFDNVIFKMVKDFTPARSNVSTGIIVKPHILHRPKAKLTSASLDENLQYSQSIAIASASSAFAFEHSGDQPYTSSYLELVQTGLGLMTSSYHNHEVAQFDGEYSGSLVKVSNSELNAGNTAKSDNNFMLYKMDGVNEGIDCSVVFFLI